MGDSQLNYYDISDYRRNPFTGIVTPKIIGWGSSTPERRTIPGSAPYIIKLFEGIQQNIPSTTKIEIVSSGIELKEVSGSPASGQYRVNYNDLQNGWIEFSSSQKNVQVDINYYGIGTQFTIESLGSLVYTTYRDSDGNESIVNIRRKIVEIGDWDMNSNPVVNVTHNLGSLWENVLLYTGIIRNDADTIRLRIGDYGGPGSFHDPFFTNNASSPSLTSTIIKIARNTGGQFDSANFDSTSYNRGWIYFIYWE